MGVAFPRVANKIWLWAILGSILVHGLLFAALFLTLVPVRPAAKRVVPVEAITFERFRPGLPGKAGGGGAPAPAKPEAPPAPPPPVTERPRPKPVVKAPRPKVQTPPPKVQPPPPPLPTPAPAPSLAMSRPPAPPPVGAGSRTAVAPGRQGTGTGSGGGSGSGVGTGQGPGSGGAGSGPGPGSGFSLKDYLKEVHRRLAARKEYPSRARRQNQEGTVLLRFTISLSGQVQSPAISRSSGHPLLDQAALDTLVRAGSMPPLPPDLGRERLTLEVPLAFRLTEN